MQLTRLDSCRGCGERLSVKTICGNCGQPKTLHCTHCTRWTEDPPHDCKMFLN
jgi:predicted amidophosphoribosyltransferase